MAGRPSIPRLTISRTRGIDYYKATGVYRPGGKRTTVSFGPVPEEPAAAAEVQEAFGRWVRLYVDNPHQALSFDSPWEALEKSINSSSIVSLGDLIDNYLRYAEGAFKLTRNGDISPNFQRLEKGIEFLAPYREWPVNKFGPDQLRKAREAMITYRYKRGDSTRQLTRKSINDMIKELRRMFTWAVGRRAMEPATEQSIANEVKPLRRGHPGTFDARKRSMVRDAEFEAVAAAVNPVVAAMMRVLRYSVCRPNEVIVMRPRDIQRGDDACWLYVPGSDVGEYGDHKTLGAGADGQMRVIPLTPDLQEIVRPFLEAAPDEDAYLFRPDDAMQRQREARHAERKTPLSSGNRPGTNRSKHPMIKPGLRYKPTSFYNAVKRGCKRADVKPFTLYDLRRASITEIDAKIGGDEATRLVGHNNAATTEIYKLDKVQRIVDAAKSLYERRS